MSPVAGVDYPGSYAAFRSWFGEDWKCLDYLDWLRWPEGFKCPHCGSKEGWRTPDRRWRCGGCDRRASATAGTIFHGTRTPLTVWFAAGWQLVASETGVSAVELQRKMGLGSYRTAWSILHRYRSVMARSGSDRLRGDVDVQTSYIGGREPDVADAGALAKVLLSAAVERGRAGSLGRARVGLIEDASAASLQRFLTSAVQPDSRISTVKWGSCEAASEDRATLRSLTSPKRGAAPDQPNPGAREVIASVTRFVLVTLHGSVSTAHLQAYLDEWAFRFNHRQSRRPGLLFHLLLSQSVEGDPVTYRDLRKAGRTRPAPPAQPAALSKRTVSRRRNVRPRLEGSEAVLPWRTRRVR